MVRISRADMLRGAAAGVAGASSLGLLAACARSAGGSGVLPSQADLARVLGVPHIPDPWGKEFVTLRIVNKTGVANSRISWLAYCRNFNDKFVHLNDAGQWVLCKSSDVQKSGPFKGYANYNLPLAKNGVTQLKLPWGNSGVIYFCVDDKLRIGVNGSGNDVAIAAPAAQNPSDPNFKFLWDNVEWSFNNNQQTNCNITANTTLIAHIAMPISVNLTSPGRPMQSGGVIKPGGHAKIISAFDADPAFRPLVVYGPKKYPLRVVGPSVAVVNAPGDVSSPKLATFFDAYVKACAAKYSSANKPFTVTYGTGTDGKPAVYSCYFNANLTIQVNAPKNAPAGNDSFSFGPMTSAAVWLCQSIGKAVIPVSGYQGDITNVILAALNRGILLQYPKQPECNVATFYKNPVGLNTWCKVIHDNFVDGKVYAFPYDDQCGDFSSTVSMSIPPFAGAKPVVWTITLEKLDPLP